MGFRMFLAPAWVVLMKPCVPQVYSEAEVVLLVGLLVVEVFWGVVGCCVFFALSQAQHHLVDLFHCCVN